MIHKPLRQFLYNDKTSNMFLFYQSLTEKLFDFSPDSYKVTTHNTHTLIVEAYNTYLFLKKDGSVDRFFDQYMGDVVEEILYSIQNDAIAKSLLGNRLEKYMSLLEQIKNDPTSEHRIKIFEANIRNLLHQFDNKAYYYAIVRQLVLNISGIKHQQEIMKLTNDFLCELQHLGYYKQHIYNVVINWFKQKIDDNTNIQDFFNIFTFQNVEWDLLIFVNKKLFNYYQAQINQIISSDEIKAEVFPHQEFKKLLTKDSAFTWMEPICDHSGSILCEFELINIRVMAYDPYNAYTKWDKYFRIINHLVTVFDNESKNGYPQIACLNYEYNKTIAIKKPMEKRLRIYGQNYAERTVAVLKQMKMSDKMFHSFLKMLSFHGDALGQNVDDKYVLLMLWTALEALFVENSDRTEKSTAVKNSLVELIQRTYIIKTIKYLQNDLIHHLKAYDKRDLIQKYSLDDVDKFLEMLFDNPASPRIKEICATLNSNPLLRTRIFVTVTELLVSDESVSRNLALHKQKIAWQISRIYRMRNFIVHTGKTMPFVGDLVEHLHNYLDYVINYIVCKVENDEIILDIRDVVTEIKIDNELHATFLSKHKGKNTSENIQEILFGASSNVVSYYKKTIP